MTSPSETTTPPANSATLAKQARAGLWCGILALVFFLLIWVAGLCTTLLRQGGTHKVGNEIDVVLGFTILICGSLSFVLSVVSIVFGAVGRRPRNITNRGVATTGLVLGSVALGLNLCCLAVALVGVFFAVRGFK
ncbi:MAG: hypothetical protein NT105_10760 [Verrucomicrobia bacterium]|nr:hypothetical protein [Verrucomicrobiota bacterium]